MSNPDHPAAADRPRPVLRRATPRQSAYFYRNAFGFDVVAYAGLETGVRHEAGYVLRQGDITFVLTSPLGADHPDSQRLVAARRRRAGHRPGGRRRAGRLRGRDRARGRRRRRRRRCWRTSTASTSTPRSAPTATRRTRFVNRDRYRGVFAPGYQAARPGPLQPAHVPPRRPEGDRPHRRQRRGREDGRVGRLLREGAGLLAAGPASTTRTSAPSTRP